MSAPNPAVYPPEAAPKATRDCRLQSAEYRMQNGNDRTPRGRSAMCVLQSSFCNRLGAALCLLALVLVFTGCRSEPGRKSVFPPLEGQASLDSMPLQILLQLHVIGWRETLQPTDDAPFPALGFRYEGDRVVPCQEPETVAGTEMTFEQFGRWMDELQKSGSATLYLAPQFSVMPNLHATASQEQEMHYVANWQFTLDAAAPRQDVLTPGVKFDLQPLAPPGMRDLVVHAELRMATAALDSFKALDMFPGKSGSSSLQLPREAIQQLTCATPLADRHSIVLGHYVKQFVGRASSPRSGAGAGDGGPAILGEQQRVREHLFFVLSAARVGTEVKADLPIVESPPPHRYAFTLAWNQWQSYAAGEAIPPEKPQVSPANRASPPGSGAGAGDGRPTMSRVTAAEIAEALRAASGSPEAVASAFSFVLIPQKQATFEIGDDRGYAAGIDPPMSLPGPHSFVIKRVRSGMRLQVQLEERDKGASAQLIGELGDTPRLDLVSRPLVPSSSGAAKEPLREYHFQAARRAGAEIRSQINFAAPETWRLNLLWREEGETAEPATPDAKERVILVSLKRLAAPPGGAPPEGSVPNVPNAP